MKLGANFPIKLPAKEREEEFLIEMAVVNSDVLGVIARLKKPQNPQAKSTTILAL